MRHNRRAPILASQMRPEHLSLRENEPRLVVCPDCHTWRSLKRSMIKPHRDGLPVETTQPRYPGDKPAGGRRCPGSAQRIIIDLTVEDWTERLLTAEFTTASRRTTRPARKPRPHAAPAVAQMPAATRSLREKLTEHQRECVRCRTNRCSRAIELRQQIRRTAQLAAAPATPIYGQLRTALRDHHASCAPCRSGAACEAGRGLAARMTGLAHDHLARTA
ncbi:hypothetical protein [Streptomyces alkaliterrae]|uniref:Uncharacterized protein n=1 Tax=Streptomyces alkaliterrae TaxID=2213162 RepID=A0A7W3WU41_9ACTN|nr:hypothetical protein [Streptomyces alkaliterrae]MBB1258305.1 hypothetical protein [Streptomyces alkaliterrae]